MNDLKTSSSNRLVMEVRSDLWSGLLNEKAFAVDIQRGDGGHLIQDSVDEVKRSICDCFEGISPRDVECICLLSGGGSSLRPIKVPVAKESAIRNLIELQIEKEWPLPPEELAWGFIRSGQSQANTLSEVESAEEISVGAIKKSLFQHYVEILEDCGLKVRFTLSACAGSFYAQTRGFKKCWILDLRSSSIDLIEMSDGIPSSIQHFNWGWNQLKGAIQELLNSSGDTSTEAFLPTLETVDANGMKEWVSPLINRMIETEGNHPVLVTGIEESVRSLLIILNHLLPEREFLSSFIASSTSFPVQVLGQYRGALESDRCIELKAEEEIQDVPIISQIPYLRWAAMLVVLCVVALLARRIEPSLRIGKLDQQLKDFQAQQKKLPEIDRELSFLEHIQQNAVPYMDLVGLLAAKSVSGFHLESLEMGSDRRVQIRGTLPQNAHPEDLRAKLLEGGWFDQVVLDEQTPDKQKRNTTVRISITLKDHLRRPALPNSVLGLERPDDTKNKSK